jgi:hypothetical protein
LIDSGNAFFPDTQRRNKDLQAKGFRFIGAAVSGGEEEPLSLTWYVVNNPFQPILIITCSYYVTKKCVLFNTELVIHNKLCYRNKSTIHYLILVSSQIKHIM